MDVSDSCPSFLEGSPWSRVVKGAALGRVWGKEVSSLSGPACFFLKVLSAKPRSTLGGLACVHLSSRSEGPA